MLEYPEVRTVAAQLEREVVGKRIQEVLPPTKHHRFAFFSCEPASYGKYLKDAQIVSAAGFGLFVDILFDNGLGLCFNDGVNLRLNAAAKDWQLKIILDDSSSLTFSVAMYGGIMLHDSDFDNEYYRKSRQAIPLLSSSFPAYFRSQMAEAAALSSKAFLATKQRFAGLGNGVLQDILLDAGINPKRAIGSLSAAEKNTLADSVVRVVELMTRQGGRNTEKDIYGHAGGYITRLSRYTLANGCPVCGGRLSKENYLGGAVYFCPRCQPCLTRP